MRPLTAPEHHAKAALERRDYVTALKYLRAALGLHPDDGMLLNNIGVCLRELGQPETAVGSFREALAEGYQHEGVYCNLGETLLYMGRVEEAIDALERCVAINPGYGPALQALQPFAFAAGMVLIPGVLPPDLFHRLRGLLHKSSVKIMRSATGFHFYCLVTRGRDA